MDINVNNIYPETVILFFIHIQILVSSYLVYRYDSFCLVLNKCGVREPLFIAVGIDPHANKTKSSVGNWLGKASENGKVAKNI